MSNWRRGLYAITDNSHSLSMVQHALQGGCSILQYREKKVPDHAYAKQLVTLCQHFSVPLIINDDPHFAHAVSAQGVHLGENDPDLYAARKLLGHDRIIGMTCYDSLDRAEHAQNAGADYVAFGSFFPTTSKVVTRQANHALLKKAREKLNIPIVAIGGITPENASGLIAAGADLVAAINGVFGSANIQRSAAAYASLFNVKE